MILEPIIQLFVYSTSPRNGNPVNGNRRAPSSFTGDLTLVESKVLGFTGDLIDLVEYKVLGFTVWTNEAMN